MKANFKPLGLAAAVATASAGYAGVANAQMSVAAETELGDLAIVPYYTVLEGFATGVNIINTSDRTQVLKFRFRRAEDSMDALDFNVVLSPEDMYTGFLALEDDGETITWTSNDNSCTAPAYDFAANKFKMPDGLFSYREGAETGYIEIISMGSPVLNTVTGADDQPIAISAKHDSSGVPHDCGEVRDNFFANVTVNAKGMAVADTNDRGVINSATTHQFTDIKGVATLQPSTYEAAPDSLKVSYFIKSDDTGVEFGDNAVHIAGFLDGPAMTNQQQGIFSGDLQGFDHPDLNGGAPLDALTGINGGDSRGRYDVLRGLLESETLINDWSENVIESLGATVDTDWVVTIPGQYVMLDLFTYLIDGADACLRVDEAALANIGVNPALTVAPCDFRDIPLTASFTVYDREEQGITVEEGDLVVSPQPPIIVNPKALKDEVNVIQWGEAPVLNAPVTISVDKPAGAKFGWAALSTAPADTDLAICEVTFTATGAEYVCDPAAVTNGTPLVGFVAWQRAFAALPEANYGRIVEHSRVQSS